jgi:hypothetical protein
MEIHEYTENDLPRIQELHALCGFDYQLPDLAAPSMVVKRMLTHDGAIQVAGFLRLTSEAFLLGNAKWRTPAWRWEALKALHEDIRHKAQILMLDDAHCWVPPELDRAFGRRLVALGWERERQWPVYSQKVNNV